MAWVVYLAADLGCLAAGYFSTVLVHKGVLPARARVRLMIISAPLPFSPSVAVAPNAWIAIFIASLATFGHLSWQTSLSSLILDLHPKRFVGIVFGIVAAGSGLGMVSSAVKVRR